MLPLSLPDMHNTHSSLQPLSAQDMHTRLRVPRQEIAEKSQPFSPILFYFPIKFQEHLCCFESPWYYHTPKKRRR